MTDRDVPTIRDLIHYQLKFYYLSHIEELPFNHINRYKERAVAV